ncbi:MAG TPA: mismatch-specific DNA-glycosylase [Candidatus Binataceae bacterium]
MPLKDILIARPRILFVGINPSLRSEAVGHHFASPGNPFWRLLYAARLVPVELTFAEDRRLAEFGLALTSLCPRATRAAAELGREEIERGKRTLVVKARRLRPEVIAFVGITIYREFLREFSATDSRDGRNRQTASTGAGAKPELLCGARVFVLPNPSGLNASFPGFRHKLVWFERLREFASQGEGRRAPCGRNREQ